MSVKEINYILKRVLQMIPVLLLVMVLIFALIRFIPGDPADVMLGARATEESRAMLHAKMGIDKPIYEQFFLFMKNCLRLDFGESILSGEPVSQILARRFQVTASLTGMTALFTMLLALPIGYFSGVNKHNAAGKAINTSALVVMAVPAFWVGILLMYFFGLKLHWFPISGWGDTFGEHVWSLILPAFTQSLGISALLIRNMQNEVAQIFTIDYVDFARSKGLAPMRVRVWYILRNVMISTTTLFSIGIASMLGGSVIIETVFSLPGLGSLIMSSILARDYPAVQGCVILFAVIIMAVNLLTDILYSRRCFRGSSQANPPQTRTSRPCWPRPRPSTSGAPTSWGAIFSPVSSGGPGMTLSSAWRPPASRLSWARSSVFSRPTSAASWTRFSCALWT